MKLSLLAIAMLLASSAVAQTEYVSLDGSWWVKASAGQRILWLQGYEDGFTQAIKLAGSLKTEDKVSMTVGERLHLRNLLRYSATNPQVPSNHAIDDEMTLFYRDFRNTPVCWSDAEVVSELALTVAAPSEVELDALRAEDARSGCGKFPVK